MSQPAAERLARLAAHLEGSSNSTRGSSSLGQQPVASSSGRAAAPSASGSGRGGDAAWHAQCFNFEPGRLLLDQVAIITGAGGGIGKSVRLALGPVFLCRRKWRPVTALPCPAMHCLRLPLSQVPAPVPPPAAGSHPVCPAGGQGGSQRLGCSKGTGKRLITDATAQPAASVQRFSSRHHCFAAHTMVHTAQPASLLASQPPSPRRLCRYSPNNAPLCRIPPAPSLQATADFIRNSCGTAIAVPGDVTDPAFPERVVAAALGAFGGLHILVNNAGARCRRPLCCRLLCCCRPACTSSSLPERAASPELLWPAACCRLHLGRHDSQDDWQAVGHDAGGALHSALPPHPGKTTPVVPPRQWCCQAGAGSARTAANLAAAA